MSTNPHPSTIAGRVDVTHLLRAGQRRAVRIYVPPGYETSGRTYPVVYMLDGNNLFDRRTSSYDQEWCLDETMEALHRTRPERTAVIVGIDPPPDTVGRYAEYSIADWRIPDVGAQANADITAGGVATAEFLAETVKPWVESHYRVQQQPGQVAIGGSSLGGYFSLYLAARFPEQFGRILAFSPVVLDHPMQGQHLRKFIADAQPDPHQRIYLDMGDAETLEYVIDPAELVDSLQPLSEALRCSGRSDITVHVAPGAAHHEQAWAGRFLPAYLWALYGEPLGEQQPE